MSACVLAITELTQIRITYWFCRALHPTIARSVFANCLQELAYMLRDCRLSSDHVGFF